MKGRYNHKAARKHLMNLNACRSVTNYEGFELYGNVSHPTHYVPRPARESNGFQYPSCDVGFSELRLLDFAFLSDLAYTNPATTQMQLDDWFGDGQVDYISKEHYPSNIPKK